MSRSIGFLLVTCALVFGSVWVAAQVDLTTFEPDTPILSSEVNANFRALDDALAALAEREGVDALNALTGAVELVAGRGIDIRVDPDSGTVTIAGNAADGGDGPAGASVPSGAVLAFSRAECPDGWSIFAPARGRTVVGVGAAGTVLGTVGDPLGDTEARLHGHLVGSQELETSVAGSHNHLWASFDSVDGEEIWSSGSDEEIFRWGNGIGNDGSGIYPLAVDAEAFDAFFTDSGGNHSHTMVVPEIPTASATGHLPYVQLLYCQRD